MAWIRRALIALAAVVVVVVVGGWWLPSTFQVSRSVRIAAPPAKVYALVASPRQWPAWSVWNQRDPKMAMTYSGPESGVGAGWAWVSASQGNGRMRFTAAEPERSVGFELLFEDFGTASNGNFSFAAEGSETRVTWSMVGDMGRNPVYHWFALNADRMVGPDFEAGLANLKALAEKP